MYCAECGFQNDLDSLYCVNDGYPLIKSNKTMNEKLTLIENNYCGGCGTKCNKTNLYCNECGQSMEKLQTQRLDHKGNKTEKMTINQLQHVNWFQPELLKKVLPGVLLTYGIVIILSLIFTTSMKSNMFIRNLGMAVFYNPSTDSTNIGILDYMMLSHYVDFSASMEYSPSDIYRVDLSFGLLILVLISVIAIFIGGWFINRRIPGILVGEKFLYALYFGVSYGIVLAVLSLFAGTSSTIPDSVSVTRTFDFLSALLNGVFLGFLGSLMGMLFHRGIHDMRTNLVQNIPFGASIHYGLSGVMKSFVIVFVFSTIMYLSFTEYFDVTEEMGAGFILTLTLLFQLTMYVFNIILFNTFEVTFGNLTSEKFSYFIFSGASGTHDAYEFNDTFSDYKIWLYIALVAVIILFIFIGRKLSESGGQFIISVVVYSIVFAVVFTYFSYESSIVYEHHLIGEENGKSKVGYNFMSTFAISFLYTAITAFLGRETKKFF